MITTDFLVLGSGIAGLLFALTAAKHGTVTILTKKARADSNTAWAQGGIASVQGRDDSIDLHLRDTLTVGSGLSRPDIVRLIVEQGPRAVAELERLGVRFSREGDRLALGREGGHSRRRVVHAGDSTGRTIEEALLASVAASPNIRVLENHCAVDLIRRARLGPGAGEGVAGAYVLDGATRRIVPFAARVVFLATGGCGKVYRFTSNPDIATGDGIAMAFRAGCRVANLEFMQFHPTCLYHPSAKNFLISEAVRGEGATLTTVSGERLEIDHPMQDLAPRDIVARAIDREMKRRGDHYVLLHMEGIGADRVRSRFPAIYETCLRFGLDVTKQPIPVVPAAHYMCGGVVVDSWGRTDLPGLYAGGETACTGLHGANRLASNSLLEATVFALRAAEDAAARLQEIAAAPALPAWEVGAASLPKETVLIDAHWDLVRRLMWDFVGIVRTDHRLELASRYLSILRSSIEAYYWDFVLDADLIELRNVALVAELIVRCARERHESRGLHYNEDHPAEDPAEQHDTVLRDEIAVQS
ncbi:MAG: L-aspartate oxidase [Candidatus Eisenbacteria bacterium]|nr:L-aspartate oxidase [Candidatus Eisenbacteria bacterium]